MKLSELIKQDQFRSPGQEAVLNVIVTSSWFLSEIGNALSPFGITPAQYNVLRILRGSHPDRMMCSAVGERLLDRTPDVTRLLNRLERAGHVERRRASHDRRVVEVNITQSGLELLDKVDGIIKRLQEQLTRHLSDEEHLQLSDILERMRTDQRP
jgi:DNA-binding MarR family transcriptional regulator